MTHLSDCKLSICISTVNRAAFIGAALDSILDQVTDDCEIVVSDNASTDGTEQVVVERSRRFGRLRYIKQEMNNGADRNIDRVVSLSRGEYCWLFTDDDVMKPGAVSTVLRALSHDYSVVLVNMEIRDQSMANVVRHRWINFDSDRCYQPGEADRMFAELDGTVVNLCNIIIKRSLWLSRNRERYFGSNFVHAGVIFQEHLPSEALVIAKTLISYRLGNVQSFASEWPEIWLERWPALVESIAISEAARKSVRISEPWRNPVWLLGLRGARFYTFSAYCRWIRPRLALMNQIMPLLISVLPSNLAKKALEWHGTVRRFMRCRPITIFTEPV